VQVGDLVRYKGLRGWNTGIIVRFDKDNDPVIWENGTDIATPRRNTVRRWRNRVEVISASR